MSRRTQLGAVATVAGAVVMLLLATVLVVASHRHPAPSSSTSSASSAAVAGRPAVSVLTAATARPLPHGPATAFKTVALASATDLPADCIPAASGPPATTYQLGLVGTVHGGVLSTGAANVANINATFCGVVTVVKGTPPCGATGTVTSPLDGQSFGPLSVALDLVPGMSPSIGFSANPGSITGGFGCGSSQGGLNVTLNATVSGNTAPLFGVSCTIGPFTIPLTGVVTGPFTNMTATLSSSNFTVPTVQGSPTCPGGVPANVDAIAGLPIAPGGASATLPVTASLYQPAS